MQGRSATIDARYAIKQAHSSAGLRPLTPTHTFADRVASFHEPGRFGSPAPTDMILGQAMRIRSVSALQSGSAQSRAHPSTRTSRTGPDSSAAYARSRPQSAGRTARRSAEFGEAAPPRRSPSHSGSGGADRTVGGLAAGAGRLQARGGARPGTPAATHVQQDNVNGGSRVSSGHGDTGAPDAAEVVAERKRSHGKGCKGSRRYTADWLLGSSEDGRPASPQAGDTAQDAPQTRAIGSGGDQATHTSVRTPRGEARTSGGRRTSATSHTASTAGKATRKYGGHRSPTRPSRASIAERRSSTHSSHSAAPMRRRTSDDVLTSTSGRGDGALPHSPSMEAFLRDSVASSNDARKRASQRRCSVVSDGHRSPEEPPAQPSGRTGAACELGEWEHCPDSAVALAASACAGNGVMDSGHVHVIADVSIVSKRDEAELMARVRRKVISRPAYAPYDDTQMACTGGKPSLAYQVLRESRCFTDELAGPQEWADLLSVRSLGGSSADSSATMCTRDSSPGSISPERAHSG